MKLRKKCIFSIDKYDKKCIIYVKTKIKVATMYVEIIKKRQGKKVYSTELIRESHKDNGKVRHRTIANISHLPKPLITQIKTMPFGKGEFLQDRELEIGSSREYGASAVFLDLGRRLGIDKLIYSRR